MRPFLSIALALCVVSPSIAGEHAVAPTMIPIEGEIKTASSDAAVAVVVSIYASKDDTTPLWSEHQLVRVDAAGRYSLSVGSATEAGIPAEVFAAGAARWIGIAAQGESEQPRTMIITVPYAVRAREAETIGGRTINDLVLAGDLEDRVETILRLPREQVANDAASSSRPLPRPNAPRFVGSTNVLPSWSVETLFPNEGWHIRAPFLHIALEDSAEAQLTANYWFIYRTGGDGKLRFARFSDRVVFDGNGNVGIGVPSPATSLDIAGAFSERGMAAPAVAPAGQGRIYFDSTANKFRASESSGAYVDLVGYTNSQIDALVQDARAVVKRVFVSSQTYTGALGPATNQDSGYQGADSSCQALATAAGLAGTFKAWVSGNDVTRSVATRFTHSVLKYVLVNGTIIANNWTDLVNGSIAAPINVDENGNTVAASDVWTGTNSDGSVRNPGADCDNSNIPGSSWIDNTQFVAGGYGRTDSTTGGWTNTNQKQCQNTARLYCFQQ